MEIAIIGVGNMGSAIIRGLVNQHQDTIVAMNPENPRVSSLAKELGFKLFNQYDQLVADRPDIVILTTPASVTTKVAGQLSDLKSSTIVISSAAGVKLADLAKVLPNRSLAAIIPNTPVAVNAGAIGLAYGQDLSADVKEKIQKALGQLGDLIVVPEDQLDIVGIVGGCGPAFVDVFMDAMSDAAVKYGLSRQTAYQLVASMVKGSGKLAADSRQAPALLRDQVTSPGGTTIRGVEALEKAGFRYAVINAVNKANG